MDNSHFDFTNWLFAAIGSAATGLWAWIRQRKRDAAEIRTAEIENVEKAITIWRNLAQDMRARVDELTAQVVALNQKVDHLNAENESLKIKVLMLEDENVRLESEIQHLKTNGQG